MHAIAYAVTVERYRSTKEKIALLVSSTSMAKAVLVLEEGIGQDLPATLVGWEGDRFVCLAQATDTIMNGTRKKRLHSLANVAALMKDGWDPDSFTFISEGYCNTGQSEDDRPLPEAFCDNHEVKECLTFIHVTNNNIIVVVLPYHQDYGRIVRYDELSKASASSFADQALPLQYVLLTDVHTLISDMDLGNPITDPTILIEHQGWQVVHDMWED